MRPGQQKLPEVMKMQTIYIVEDDANIREIESYALSKNGFLTREFEMAVPFYQALEQETPDLVLLDIMLPDEDGMNVLKKLRTESKTRDIPVILITAKSSEIDTVRGLDSGADDYIIKPFRVMELISRVRALLRRSGRREVEEVIRLGEILLDPPRRKCFIKGQEVDLTYKEYELLLCFMINAGIVMKRTVLMDKIWGIDYEGESRTLDAHIKSLRKKLGEAGTHIKTVRNVGYILS